MAIDQEALKSALAGAYDPKADYLVCGYNDIHRMHAKGYTQVGVIQDPSPADQDLLIFVRPKVEPPKPREVFIPKPAPEPPAKAEPKKTIRERFHR